MKISFSSLHPFVNFFYYIGVMILCMMCLHPLFLIGAILLIVIINVMQGNSEKIRKMLPSTIVFFFMVILFNSLLTHRGRTTLFWLGDSRIKLEAIMFGVVMGLLLVAIMFTFASYNDIISSHKFLYLFSRISPKVALLTMITVRFVPLFMRRLQKITLVPKNKRCTSRCRFNCGTSEKWYAIAASIINLFVRRCAANSRFYASSWIWCDEAYDIYSV